jgi:hypothetical protein
MPEENGAEYARRAAEEALAAIQARGAEVADVRETLLRIERLVIENTRLVVEQRNALRANGQL